METQIMRTFVLAAALLGAASLAACSDSAEDAAETGADATATAEATDAAAAPTADANAVLNANSATAEQLAASGLTPEAAAAIVAGAPYASVVDLNAKLQEALSPDAATAALASVFVPVNLNTASREEIQLIPGMTDRMVGEFLEYRPYEDMAEFDREIGKYVDEAEVARFRRYVTL
jgi:DNA uptake protein ComE-like DNA-binding protein